MSRSLPEFPNLEHLKKQAKVLLRELQQSNHDAKLTQAQHTIAREYGFASWTKLKAHVESLPQPAGGGRGTTSGPVDPQPLHDSGGGGGLFPRFTEKARQMIFFARYSAKRGTIEAPHLFMALTQPDGDLMKHLLGQSTGDAIQKAAERLTTNREKPSPGVETSLSSECRRILEHAAEEADRLGHHKISPGHFLLAFLREEGTADAKGTWLTSQILNGLLTERGMRRETARDQITRFLNEEAL